MTRSPVFAKGRDLDATAASLRPWPAARLGVANVEIDGLDYPLGAGVSNETVLFRARWGETTEDLVLRVAPAPDHHMFLEPRFPMQHAILVALDGFGEVRAPRALWMEEDPALLGRPFYLMRRLPGRVPVSMPVYNDSGRLAEARPAQRRTLWDNAMAQLAAVHRVPSAAVAFVDRPEHGSTGDLQQLSYWSHYATWALGAEMAGPLGPLFDWLARHRPPPSEPGLSWGDARIGNMMFDSGFQVVGVMDWEQASFAGPVADLAWWLSFDEAHSAGVSIGNSSSTVRGRSTSGITWRRCWTPTIWLSANAGCSNIISTGSRCTA